MTGNSVQTSAVAQGGFAYGLDGGVRFARQLYIGLELEHASLTSGKGVQTQLGVDSVSSNTTSLSAVLGFIVDPDRPSFYVDLTAGVRWFHIGETDTTGSKGTTLDSGELGLGAGVWIPAGRNFRVLPKASLNAGSFGSDSGSSAQHVFVMVGVAGFFTNDF
jgi:Autotransporter beta-domain